MALSRIDTIVLFTEGGATPWSDLGVPVPNKSIAIDTDNKVVKEGDGSTLFADLPVCSNTGHSQGPSLYIQPLHSHSLRPNRKCGVLAC